MTSIQILFLGLLLGLGRAAARFCEDGIGAVPSFEDDDGSPSVDVIVAQAALFSTNPKIGTLFGRFNWFHTALVFRQQIGNGSVRHWTLEFDAVTEGSTFAATVPAVDGDNLTWGETGMAYCLTEGILWGREHWLKSYETVLTLNAAQALRTFDKGVGPVNATTTTWDRAGPQYQLFAVEERGRHKNGTKTLIKDMTCGDGVSWFLFFATTLNNVSLRRDFRLKVTHIVFKARSVTPMNSSSLDWHAAVESYTELAALFTDPIVRKPLDLLRYVPLRALYDANAETYYKVEGNPLPFVHFQYIQVPICSPPWTNASRCLDYQDGEQLAV